MVSSALITPPPFTLIESNRRFNPLLPSLLSIPPPPTPLYRPQQTASSSRGISCLISSSFSPPPTTTFNPSTRLYVSGLSFRTTEESLRNAFKNFGELIEVNLVMDRIANRPRGFAFLKYSSEEESKKAIEGMHGKFLDGRVIFVEVAKSRVEVLANNSRENPDRAEFIRGRLGHRVKTKAFKIMSLLANRAGYASYPI